MKSITLPSIPLLSSFISALKRNELDSSKISLITCTVLKSFIEITYNNYMNSLNNKTEIISIGEFIEQLRYIGKIVANARPIELSVGNIVRRILHTARTDAMRVETSETITDGDKLQDVGYSLYKILDDNNIDNLYKKSITKKFIEILELELDELHDEIQHLNSELCEHALEHIHADETVLTHGFSKTVLDFLGRAKELDREFTVFVVEAAPSYDGHKMVNALSKLKINTILIPDSAIFAIMPKVNKVIIGTHAVLANGGAVAYSGALNIAIAARQARIPFVVLTGLYKLCPAFAYDQDTFNECRPPSQILKFSDFKMLESINVENPAFDYVAPEYVSLFVSNFGGHNPSYVYRLLAELYSQEDYDFE